MQRQYIRPVSGYLAILLACVALFVAIARYASTDIEEIRHHFLETSAASAAKGAREVDRAIRSIYENLRTLATLPSVIEVDRHGTNLDADDKMTIQQIYNGLATSVDVSEVYIVPENLNPDRIDPVTGRPEEPIIMFDHTILNAGANLSLESRMADPDSVAAAKNTGPPEIEIHEYRQFTEHMDWFRSHYPTARHVSGLRVPFISGPEVITCDNTDFIASGDDTDRAGIIFSVPFYGPDSKFKGTVSAIILSNSLRKLLPSGDFVLVNPGNGYVNAAKELPHIKASAAHILHAIRNPDLISSEVVPLATTDYGHPWFVWFGQDNSVFHNSPEVRAIHSWRLAAFAVVAAVGLLAAFGWFVVLRDFDQARFANIALAKGRDEARRAEEESRRAETSAYETAQQLQRLNSNVSRLNLELAKRMQELQSAQEDIVRKGRMAQLGQLTATVAHELRNPMSTIRNTAFSLRRKLAEMGVDLGPQMSRIENGIVRCDGIINQLLDFTRSKKPDLTRVNVDRWLAEALTEETRELPSGVTLDFEQHLQDLEANMDPARMRRAITNLISNAVEAMVRRDGLTPRRTTANPKISVTSRQTKRGVEITVADNGPGMTAEVLAKVREPLFTTKNFGTGLGLPAVERILELNDGGLDIWSKPGQGTQVTIWFPAQQTETVAA
ncbi:MAG: HAMP domain-containing histidine kinase [Alphaproteobacteria bacterium]|nr:HAMP domain-containing histidine kinase [Alphaproteobacteria bacterium]